MAHGEPGPILGTIQWWFLAALPWIMGAFSLAMLGYSGHEWWVQQYRLAHRRAVPVRIVSSEVETHHHYHGATWSPKIRFRYTVNGRSYEGSRCMPVDDQGLYWWAHRVVRDNPAGAWRTGYYVDTDAADAFLIPRYSFEPYLFLVFGLMLLATVPSLRAEGRLNRLPQRPELRMDGWYELRRGRDPATRARQALVLCIAWLTTASVICGHYFWIARSDYEWSSYLITGVSLAGGLIALAWLRRQIRASWRLESSRVFVSDATLSAERPVDVLVELSSPEGDVGRVRIGLVAEMTRWVGGGGHGALQTVREVEQWCEPLPHQLKRAGRTVSAQVRLVATPFIPTSIRRRLPLHRWHVRVVTTAPGGGDAVAQFPIIAAQSQPASSVQPVLTEQLT